jgi:PEP-CTERM motif
MKAFRQYVGAAVGVIGLVMTTAPRATAGSITYTETAVGSGSLGGTSFTDTLITIIATADTANVMIVNPGVFDVNNASTTVDVSGIGSGTFTDTIVTFVNNNVSTAGITDLTIPADILGVANSVFATYGLTTSVGPASGAPDISTGKSFSTTDGVFHISSISGEGTFQATLQSVPEPSTLTLTSIGILGLLFCSWRRPARAVG